MRGIRRERSEQETVKVLQPSLPVFLSQYVVARHSKSDLESTPRNIAIHFQQTIEMQDAGGQQFGIVEYVIDGHYVVSLVKTPEERISHGMKRYESVLDLVDAGWRLYR
jgi:hypothetical protein